MTKQVSVTHSVVATVNGVTRWPQIQVLTEYTVDTLFEFDFRLNSLGEKLIAVAGTDVTLETDPVVIDADDIRGFQITSDEAITIDVNTLGSIPVKSAISDGVSISTLKLENPTGLPANVDLKIWGMKA